jgi:Tol biopolymer transport system component
VKRNMQMRGSLVILILLLLMSLTSSVFLSTVKCEWNTPLQLTNNTADDQGVSISGDGSKMAYYSNQDGDYEIFVVNSDGSGLTQLTQNTAYDYEPSISGDGSKIAFRSNVDGDGEIFVVNSDGSGLTQLTQNTAYDSVPSISGDGSKIAFQSNINGYANDDIFVVNSDGTGLTQLTSNTASDRYPSISGDGSKIAFASYATGDWEIFVVNSDGTGLTQLTSGTAIHYNPSISGDGSKIAFDSSSDSGYDIFVVNSDGTGLTQLTSNTASDRYPSISGDGSKIAFQSNVGGDWEIFVVNSDGTGLTQLTSNTADDQYPSISGDGSKIAFQSNVGGDWEIFVVSQTSDDTTPPTGSIVINGGAAYATSSSVTLSLTYSDSTSGVDQVRYSNDGVWDTESWETPATSKAWTLSGGDGVKTVYYQVRDNAGNTFSTSDGITLDTTAPIGSILINGGAASTTTPSVTLSLTYSDATSGVDQVRYSNDGTWDTESWESPAASKAWTLSGGNGLKTVYYQIRDNAGLISNYWDQINFIIEKVATPTFNPSGGTYPSFQSVTINCDTSDATIRYTTDGSEPTAFSTLYSTPIVVNSGTVTIKAKAFKNGMTDSDTATAIYTITSPDNEAPTTQHDYDGLLHINKATITLTATDNNEVAETYYRINDGPTLTISANGQPEITTQGDNNKIEFWSVDAAGNQELPHNVLTGIRLVIRDIPILIT